jgi:D-3-phosphoglycerate dehydrogenase
MNVLYLPMANQVGPWSEEVVKAVGKNHNLTLLDDPLPIAPQFAVIDVVIDHGGSVGTHEMMDAAAEFGVKFWQILGTGFDHFDLDYIKSKGIPVGNCPGLFSSIPLAETAMMYILMLAHHYREGSRNFESGVLYQPIGRELDGAVLGILGFGASGQDLARRAKAFGMRIHATDVRAIEPEILEEIQPDFLGTSDDTDRVVSESDYLSVHLHLNAETRHTIDARRIALMKPTACLINVARGALIDEAAMHEALLDGSIGGAGLDAFEQEPPDPDLPAYQLPNVIATPHIAGTTTGTARRRAQCAADNADRIAQGLEPLYRIDQ